MWNTHALSSIEGRLTWKSLALLKYSIFYSWKCNHKVRNALERERRAFLQDRAASVAKPRHMKNYTSDGGY